MDNRIRRSRGFTLLEVTFATGILFLSFILVLGALAQLAGVREMAERRQLAIMCFDHCAEQLRQQPPDKLAESTLVAPEGLPGAFDIRIDSLADPFFSRAVRLTVVTHTSRGHEIIVSALCRPGAARDAT